MKPWYKSKTIWFNLIAGAIPLIAANISIFQPLMTAATFVTFTSVVMISNLAIRLVTTSGITLFQPDA